MIPASWEVPLSSHSALNIQDFLTSDLRTLATSGALLPQLPASFCSLASDPERFSASGSPVVRCYVSSTTSPVRREKVQWFLKGSYIFQVGEASDVSESLRSRAEAALVHAGSGSRRRVLRVALTDGFQTVEAIECGFCAALTDVQLGGKLRLVNPMLRNGKLLLQGALCLYTGDSSSHLPSTTTLLGGHVVEIHAAVMKFYSDLARKLRGDEPPSRRVPPSQLISGATSSTDVHTARQTQATTFSIPPTQQTPPSLIHVRGSLGEVCGDLRVDHHPSLGAQFFLPVVVLMTELLSTDISPELLFFLTTTCGGELTVDLGHVWLEELLRMSTEEFERCNQVANDDVRAREALEYAVNCSGEALENFGEGMFTVALVDNVHRVPRLPSVPIGKIVAYQQVGS